MVDFQQSKMEIGKKEKKLLRGKVLASWDAVKNHHYLVFFGIL